MHRSALTVLAIESSCDETAVSLLQQDNIGQACVLAEQVASQIQQHAPYGGVVPEIAARAHLQILPALVEQTMSQAGLGMPQIDHLVATTGPGLIGGLLVGSMFARAAAYRHRKPFWGIHHLEGHLLSPRISNRDMQFPFLALLASGGHTQIVLVHDVGKYQILGRSRDDALGEALDKSATVMGLGYPGGALIEKLANTGDSERFTLPSPLVGARDVADRQGCDFSFSGVKTAVARLWQQHGNKDGVNQTRADLAAGLQTAVAKVLCDRLHNAFARCQKIYPNETVNVAFVGGVAANVFLQQQLRSLCQQHDCALHTVPLKWCTDNATMIGWAALERINNHYCINPEHDINRPRWSLETLS